MQTAFPIPMARALPRVDPKVALEAVGGPDSGDGKRQRRLERAFVVGHPQRRILSFSLYDNLLLDHDKRPAEADRKGCGDCRRVHYRAPTEHGSSGSPVFSGDWNVIAVHHRGLEEMPRICPEKGFYPANEGIWIQAIIERIAKDLAPQDPPAVL